MLHCSTRWWGSRPFCLLLPTLLLGVMVLAAKATGSGPSPSFLSTSMSDARQYGRTSAPGTLHHYDHPCYRIATPVGNAWRQWFRRGHHLGSSSSSGGFSDETTFPSGNNNHNGKRRKKKEPPPQQQQAAGGGWRVAGEMMGVEWSLRRVRSTPSLELIDAAKAAGTPPDPSLYAPALRECRYLGDGRRALSLLMEMKATDDDGVVVREADCLAVMGAAAASNLTDEALHLFYDLMPHWGVPRRQGSYAAAIVTCSRARRWGEAAQAFRMMRQQDGGLRPDGACYAAMMECYRRQGRADKAVHLYRQMKEEGDVAWTSGSLTASMRALGEQGKADEALQVFQEAATTQAADLRLDTSAFAAALDACSELGRGRLAVDLLVHMKGQGLRINPGLYERAARACGRGREWESALSLLYMMEQHAGGQQAPSERVYGWVIGACAEAGQWEKGLTLLCAMQVKGLRVPPRALSLLVRSLVVAGEGQRAITTLIAEQDLITTTTTTIPPPPAAQSGDGGGDGGDGGGDGRPGRLSSLGGAWAALVVAASQPPQEGGGGGVDNREAVVVVVEALEHLIREVATTTRSGGTGAGGGAGVVAAMSEADLGKIIEASCQAGCVSVARRLLDACYEHLPSRTNVIMHTSIINRLAFEGRIGEALGVLRVMEEERSVAADVVLLTTLLDACLQAGAMEEASLVSRRLQQVKEEGGGVDVEALAVRLRECVMRGQTQEARRLLEEAGDGDDDGAGIGAVPALCYSVVLGGAAQEGHWKDAIEVLDLMRCRGLEPSEADLTSAIRACTKAGRWEAACRLLELVRMRVVKEKGGSSNSTAAYALVMTTLAKALPP